MGGVGKGKEGVDSPRFRRKKRRAGGSKEATRLQDCLKRKQASFRGRGALTQIDAGKAVLLSDLLRTQVLFDGDGVVGTSLDSGIVGNYDTLHPLYAADARHDAPRRHIVLLQQTNNHKGGSTHTKRDATTSDHNHHSRKSRCVAKNQSRVRVGGRDGRGKGGAMSAWIPRRARFQQAARTREKESQGRSTARRGLWPAASCAKDVA